MRKGVTFMLKEVKRYGVIAATLQGKMSNREAAAALRIRKTGKAIQDTIALTLFCRNA